MKTTYQLRKTCLVSLGIWSALSAHTQALTHAPGDTNQVQTYLDEGKRVVSNSLDSSYYYFQKALTLADSLDFDLGKYRAYRALTAVEAKRGDTEACVAFVEKAQEIIDKLSLPMSNRVDLLINYGVSYLNSGLQGKALEVFIEAEEIARQSDLDLKRSIILNNMGAIYRRFKRYDDAIDLYLKSLAVRLELGDSIGMANNYFNMGSVHALNGNYEESLSALDKAEELYSLLDQTSDLMTIPLLRGHTLFKLGRKEESMSHLLPLLTQDNLPFTLQHYALLYLTVGEYYFDQDQLTKAEELMEEIGPYLQPSDLSEQKLVYFQLASQIKKALNKEGEAYEMLLKHNDLSEELTEEESLLLRREMESKYMALEQDLQIQAQTSELSKKKAQNIIYAIGAIIFAVLSALLLRLNRSRKKVNEILAEKQLQLEDSLEEKDTLLKEIHHRVKNNLQVVSALLQLQSKYLKDENAVAALQNGQSRVESMALIHRDLYQQGNLKGVNTKIYLDQLVNNLLESYQIQKGEIEVETDIEALWLDVDTMIPLGLLTNELISNALKHAFEGRQGKIFISLIENGELLQLVVRDNGRGMSNQSDTNKKSFGYSLVESFARRLNATVEIENKGGYSITLKIKNYEKLDIAV